MESIALLQCDTVKHELRVVSHDFLVTSWKLESTVKIQKCEFKSTSYKFKSTNCESKSTSSRIIKLIKIQVNSLKISSFSKVLSLKSFGN